MRRPAVWVLGVMAVAALVFLLPTALELRTISRVMDQFRLDSAVQEQVEESRAQKMSADEILNPSFLKRYGLDLTEYLDADGYFAPNGVQWSHWGAETKTAAILLWKPKAYPSAWRLRHAIHRIDDYYHRRDMKTPVVRVVEAIAKEPSQ